MSTTTDLTTLKINYLTQAQYDAEVSGGTINEDEIYMTPTSDLINLFYPVGSYYETSDTSFDPNVSWGGTWVLELEGQVHVSGVPAGNYEVDGANQANGVGVSDGGAGMVTLTANEIPAHTHGNKSLTAGFSGRRSGGNDAVSHWAQQNATVTQSSSSGTTTTASGTANKHTDIVTFNLSHEHSSVGGGQAHENMPPYIVVNRWHRTA